MERGGFVVGFKCDFGYLGCHLMIQDTRGFWPIEIRQARSICAAQLIIS